MAWKILSSEYLVRSPWAVLRKDRCLTDKNEVVPEYYVLEYPSWVNIVALTKENQFILVKQYRHGVEKELLEIPGGVVEEGEDLLEGAKRELLEETGYEFDAIKPIAALYANPATSNNLTTTYLATGGVKTSPQNLDEHEDIEVVLKSAEEVKSLLRENAFGQALHTAGLFYALLVLGESF